MADGATLPERCQEWLAGLRQPPLEASYRCGRCTAHVKGSSHCGTRGTPKNQVEATHLRGRSRRTCVASSAVEGRHQCCDARGHTCRASLCRSPCLESSRCCTRCISTSLVAPVAHFGRGAQGLKWRRKRHCTLWRRSRAASVPAVPTRRSTRCRRGARARSHGRKLDTTKTYSSTYAHRYLVRRQLTVCGLTRLHWPPHFIPNTAQNPLDNCNQSPTCTNRYCGFTDNMGTDIFGPFTGLFINLMVCI